MQWYWFWLQYKLNYFHKAMLILNAMILILTAIQTILLSQSNMQWSFQYHIRIGIEYNDINFVCNTNHITFAKQYALKLQIPYWHWYWIQWYWFWLQYKGYYFRKAIFNEVFNTILEYIYIYIYVQAHWNKQTLSRRLGENKLWSTVAGVFLVRNRMKLQYSMQFQYTSNTLPIHFQYTSNMSC